MKKYIALLLSMMLGFSALTGCADEKETEAAPAAEPTVEVSAEPEETPAPEESAAAEVEEEYESVVINLGGLKGPTSMGMVKLLEDNENGLTANEYVFTMAGNASDLTPSLLKGELDILAVPVNLGSILANNSNGAVELAAVNTLGVMYIVEKGGEEIKSWEDLKGVTMYSTGKGSTPEFALAYLLSQHGLELGTDVIVEFKNEPTEIVSAMAQEEHAVALLPQPFVTVAKTQLEDLNVALDLDASWKELDNGSRLVTAGLIVRKAFAEEHPEALAKFLEEYAASTAYVNENVEEAAELVEKFDIVKAAIVKQAIPYCNIVCVTGEEMKTMVEGYLEVLYDASADSVGGALPGDEFYWINE